MKKIKINKLPKGFHRMPNGRIMRNSDRQKMEKGGQPVLGPTSRAAANLEAEKGETVVTDLDNNMIPEHYKIGGKKHSEGGTPLNLPSKSFIFSDHRSMALKGAELKKFFPETKKKSMTPAQIASMKRFDMSRENEILKDENSDAMSKATAERNIQTKLTKLGELALAQEGKKDFKDGIPEIALPYLNRNGVTPEQVDMINAEMDRANQTEMMMAMYGGSKNGRSRMYAEGGEPVNGPAPFTATKDKIQKVINHWTVDQGRKESPLTPEDFIVVSQKYDIPVDVLLTMAATESYFGITPRSAKTKNPLNWRNTTGGDNKSGKEQDKYNKYFETYRDGLEAAAEGLVRLYKPESGNWYELFEDDAFVVQRGNKNVKAGARYATNPNYEKATRDIRGTVLKEMGTDVDSISAGIVTAPLQPQGKGDDTKMPSQGKGDDPDMVFQGKGDDPDMVFQGKGDDPDLVYTPVELEKVPENGEDFVPIPRKTPKQGDDDPDLIYTPVDLEEIPEDEEDFVPIPRRTPEQADEWPDLVYTPVDLEEVPEDEEDFVPLPEKENVTQLSPNAFENAEGYGSTPFYMQDMLKLGNLMGQRANRYYGYTQRLQPFLPDPAFMSPERELQAGEAIYNQAANTFGLTGDSRMLGARLSGMQGKIAEQQANTLAKYSNANTTIDNQFELARNEALNKYALLNAAQNRQQAIDTATVNQQYDNFKRQRNTDIANQAAQAFENRAFAHNANMMFPQFQIDPSNGGMGRFTDWDPEEDNNPVDAWRQQYINLMLNQPMTKAEESAAQKKMEAEAKAAASKSKGGHVFNYQGLRKFIKR